MSERAIHRAVPMRATDDAGASDELPDDFFAALDAWFAAGGGAPIGAVAAVDVVCAPPPASRALPVLKPKNSTQRQKEELQFLRSKCSELEAQLQTLKRSRGAVESEPDIEWKEVAKRQRSALSKSEAEKAALVNVVQRQLKVAIGLERLIGKQEVWDHLHEAKWRKSELDGQADAQVFSRLLRSIDARSRELDTFRSAGLDGVVADMEEVKLGCSPADGVVFEVKHAKLIPFSFRAVEDVVWRSIQQGRLKLDNDQVTVMKQSADTVLTKVTVQEPPIIAKPTTLYQAMRRRTGVVCTYIDWGITALIAGAIGAEYPPIQVTVRGRGRLQPATLSCGAGGSVFHEVSTTTLTVVDAPRHEAETTAEPSEHREIAILTRVFESLYQQKRASIRQTIENLMLDAILTTKTVQ